MLERIHRVLVEGRDENDVRRLGAGHQPRRHVQARHAGHADVEEHHVRRFFIDHAQGFKAVGRLGHHLQFGPRCLQLAFQIITQMFFVICDQGTECVDVGLAFKGSMRRTVMPQG